MQVIRARKSAATMIVPGDEGVAQGPGPLKEGKTSWQHKAHNIEKHPEESRRDDEILLCLLLVATFDGAVLPALFS